MNRYISEKIRDGMASLAKNGSAVVKFVDGTSWAATVGGLR